MARFRFQDLQIWQEAMEITDHLLNVADTLEEKKHYRFAEQLRGATMSITNNIAEGSGSFSKKDFANFLNISRRSLFEVVNILILLERRKYLEIQFIDTQINQLDILSRKITNFRKSLNP